MEHEDFPVPGFEFMNEPATIEQKQIIVDLAAKLNIHINIHDEWPNPFTKWDANNMIEGLKAEIAEHGKPS